MPRPQETESAGYALHGSTLFTSETQPNHMHFDINVFFTP